MAKVNTCNGQTQILVGLQRSINLSSFFFSSIFFVVFVKVYKEHIVRGSEKSISNGEQVKNQAKARKISLALVK